MQEHTAIEIIGVALYSDNPTEIIQTIQQNIDSLDEYILAACAHAIGHLARRFTVYKSELYDYLMQRAAEFSDSDFLIGAIVDMDGDIKHCIKK